MFSINKIPYLIKIQICADKSKSQTKKKSLKYKKEKRIKITKDGLFWSAKWLSETRNGFVMAMTLA